MKETTYTKLVWLLAIIGILIRIVSYKACLFPLISALILALSRICDIINNYIEEGK
jgi:hypothetical protein